jgi:hypothetical protein
MQTAAKFHASGRLTLRGDREFEQSSNTVREDCVPEYSKEAVLGMTNWRETSLLGSHESVTGGHANGAQLGLAIRKWLSAGLMAIIYTKRRLTILVQDDTLLGDSLATAQEYDYPFG